MPSITRSFAPGIASAVARPWGSGRIGSSLPWITSVGVRTARSGSSRSGDEAIASWWFCAASMFFARAWIRASRARTVGSSNGSPPPASVRQSATAASIRSSVVRGGFSARRAHQLHHLRRRTGQARVPPPIIAAMIAGAAPATT